MNQKHMDWIFIEIHMDLNISWRECLVSYTWNWWKPKCGKFFKIYFKIPYVPSTSPNTGGGLFSFLRKSFLKGGSYLFFSRKELSFKKKASKWFCHIYLLIRKREKNWHKYIFIFNNFICLASFYFISLTSEKKCRRMRGQRMKSCVKSFVKTCMPSHIYLWIS